jgi:hypothetical protein
MHKDKANTSGELMINRFKINALLTPLGFLVISCAHSDSISVSVGQQRISLPSLPKLNDMRTNDRVIEWGGTFLSPNARLLSVFLDKENPGVNSLTIDRYMILQTPKKWENSILAPSDFQELKSLLRKSSANLSTLSERANIRISGQEQQVSKALDVQLQHLKIGSPLLIEVQRDDDHSYSFIYAASFQASVESEPRSWTSISCSSTLFLRGKLLISNIFSLYREASDIEWVRNTCRDFVNITVSGNL